jgi:hypothetical protein
MLNGFYHLLVNEFVFVHTLFFDSSFVLKSVCSDLTSSGSLNYMIMQVMLSVPVPSDIVISPFAIPWFISSSIMNEVSPLIFGFFNPSFLPTLVGDDPCLVTPRGFLEILDGEPITPFFGPFSRF